MMRLQLTVAGLGLALAACGALVAEIEPEDPVEHRLMHGLDATSLLVEIDGFRQLDLEQAVLLREKLSERPESEAGLRLALLELYGPEVVRDPARARARLRELEADLPAFVHADASLLVGLVETHWQRVAELEQRILALSRQLVQEQAAHAETRDKLEGLRRIEQEIGNREEGGNGQEPETIEEPDNGGR